MLCYNNYKYERKKIMKKHKQNNEYILKEDIGFLKWFRENKNSHFYLTLDEIQNMISKISNYYVSNISNIEIDDLLDNEFNVLEEYFLDENFQQDNSKYILLKEKETLKCDYRIKKPASVFETKKQDHWSDYIWFYISIDNNPLYIGAYRDGIIREDDAKKNFRNIVENKISPLTLKELYDELSKFKKKGTDIDELKEILDIHQKDLILRDIISSAIASDVLYSKQNDFISNLKRAKLFLKNIDNYNIDEVQKKKDYQFTLK